MMSRLLLLVFLFLSTEVFSQSFYSLKITSASGDTIDFSGWQGKRVLLVNVSSAGARAVQLLQLESLHQQYRDSGLVIIAFPSNDFGSEPRSGAALQNFYGRFHFLIAAKCIVKGKGKLPVYQWLAQQNMNAEVSGDYQKFLISKQGLLSGTYSGLMPPFDSILIKALNQN